MSSITQLFGYICVYIPIFISAYIKKDVGELEKISLHMGLNIMKKMSIYILNRAAWKL